MASEPNSPIPVVLDDAPRMNLLGLLMRGLLVTNLAEPRLAARAARLKGTVEVAAGRMVANLAFEGPRIVIRTGPAERARARVAGDMVALLDVVTRRALVGPVLSGKVRLGGNLFFLLRLLPLIRTL
jgi:hypothetical protein